MSVFSSASRLWSFTLRRACVPPSHFNINASIGNSIYPPFSSYNKVILQPKNMDRQFSSSPSPKACGCAGRRGKQTAYIALGSNLGDRVAMIEQACKEMDSRGIKVKRTSSLWETEPMYVLDQDRFVNGACEVCLRIPTPYRS